MTDFFEGPTLRQWRETRERVELDEAIDATRELLAILSKCHEAGLVHRDVKPDNIILADDDPGRPVLLDFGLSFRKGSDITLKPSMGRKSETVSCVWQNSQRGVFKNTISGRTYRLRPVFSFTC